jgi:hypothetical protein
MKDKIKEMSKELDNYFNNLILNQHEKDIKPLNIDNIDNIVQNE